MNADSEFTDSSYAIGNTVEDEHGKTVTIKDLYYKGKCLMAELEYINGSRMHVSVSSIKTPE